MRRTAVLLPAIAVITGASAFAAISPAAAGSEADGTAPLSVSTDGSAFVPGPVNPLFIGINRFIPGSVDRRDLWVRNDSGETAWFWATYRLDQVSPTLQPYLRLVGSYAPERAAPGATPAVTEGQCTSLLPSQRLDPGEVVSLEFAATLLPEAPNDTRLTHGRYSVRLGLAQDIGQEGIDGCTEPTVDPGPGEPVDIDEPDGQGGGDENGQSGKSGQAGQTGQEDQGPLAVTGPVALVPWLVAALGALVGGIGVLGAGRLKRRRSEEGR